MRRTHAMVQVALALMEDPSAKHWGYDLSRRSGVRSGVLYPLLSRMLEAEWITDGWESGAEAVGRPARRYYTLTERGRREIGGVLDAARDERRFASLFRWV
ncbi:MAG: PadR family transcriptional regulator [Acidimicrobiales bacterium]